MSILNCNSLKKLEDLHLRRGTRTLVGGFARRWPSTIHKNNYAGFTVSSIMKKKYFPSLNKRKCRCHGEIRFRHSPRDNGQVNNLAIGLPVARASVAGSDFASVWYAQYLRTKLSALLYESIHTSCQRRKYQQRI